MPRKAVYAHLHAVEGENSKLTIQSDSRIPALIRNAVQVRLLM